METIIKTRIIGLTPSVASWDQETETYDWMQIKTPGASDYDYGDSQPNDNEDATLRLHSGVRGDRSADWGDPGMSHGTKDRYYD